MQSSKFTCIFQPAGQFRFNNEIEIALFKETINLVPYNYDRPETMKVWKEVADNTCAALGLNQVLRPRSAMEKVYAQVQYYLKENFEMLQK